MALRGHPSTVLVPAILAEAEVLDVTDAKGISVRQALAEQHGLDLAVCVAAGLRRGITEAVMAPGFRITGLGQLIEACIDADRTLVFGD